MLRETGFCGALEVCLLHCIPLPKQPADACSASTAHTAISSERCPHTHSGALHPCQRCSGMGAVPLGAASFFSSRTRDAVHRWDALQPSAEASRSRTQSPVPLSCCKGTGMVLGVLGSLGGSVPIAAVISVWAPQTLVSLSRADSKDSFRGKRGCKPRLFPGHFSHSNPPPPQQLSLPLCLKRESCCPWAEPLPCCLGPTSLPVLPLPPCSAVWRHSVGSGPGE